MNRETAKQQLQLIGFDAKSCEKILKRKLTDNNRTPFIDSILEETPKLIALGFSHTQLATTFKVYNMKQIPQLVVHSNALITLGITTEQIIKIVAHDGGANNIIAIQDVFLAIEIHFKPRV